MLIGLYILLSLSIAKILKSFGALVLLQVSILLKSWCYYGCLYYLGLCVTGVLNITGLGVNRVSILQGPWCYQGSKYYCDLVLLGL